MSKIWTLERIAWDSRAGRSTHGRGRLPGLRESGAFEPGGPERAMSMSDPTGATTRAVTVLSPRLPAQHEVMATRVTAARSKRQESITGARKWIGAAPGRLRARGGSRGAGGKPAGLSERLRDNHDPEQGVPLEIRTRTLPKSPTPEGATPEKPDSEKCRPEMRELPKCAAKKPITKKPKTPQNRIEKRSREAPPPQNNPRRVTRAFPRQIL